VAKNRQTDIPAPKRVKAQWVGGEAWSPEHGTIRPGDVIEVWDHQIPSNPNLAEHTEAKPAKTDKE
jgi:hypothetical protein